MESASIFSRNRFTLRSTKMLIIKIDSLENQKIVDSSSTHATLRSRKMLVLQNCAFVTRKCFKFSKNYFTLRSTKLLIIKIDSLENQNIIDSSMTHATLRSKRKMLVLQKCAFVNRECFRFCQELLHATFYKMLRLTGNYVS